MATCFAYGQNGRSKAMGDGETEATVEAIYTLAAEEVFMFLQ
jgi:hypothetical protein